VEAEGIPPFAFSPRVVAVKGILVFGKAALFAGRRRNAGLGRSVCFRGYPPAEEARRRQRMSGGRRGGERRRVCATKRMHRRRHERSSHALGRRVLRSVLRPVRVDPHYARDVKASRGGAFGSASRLGKPTRVGGTSTGVGRMDAARLAARHRFRKEEAWRVEKRKEVEASVPARIKELGFVLARRVSVAEVGRRRLASNKLGKRAPKRAVRVE